MVRYAAREGCWNSVLEMEPKSFAYFVLVLGKQGSYNFKKLSVRYTSRTPCFVGHFLSNPTISDCK